MKSDNIKVSICCVTYNHEEYIEDAIKSFLNQKVDFPIEILIHDDASTDQTANIIKNFQSQYPNLIRGFYQKENQYSKGIKVSSILFNQARGKYIAWCEGDDYWIDDYKLQKQINFLENNPNYVLSVHNILWVWQDIDRVPEIRERNPKDTYTIEDHINPGARATVGHTCSAVFIKDLTNNLPMWFYRSVYEDVPLFTYIGGFGLTNYINEVMAVHRIHRKSLSSQGSKTLDFYSNKVKMYEEIDRHYKYKYHDKLIPILSNYYAKLLRFRREMNYLEYLRILFKTIITGSFHSNPIFTRLKRKLKVV